MESLELILPLGLGLVLAASAGLRAFIPLFTISILGWLGVLDLGESMEWMGTPTAALCFSAAVLIEVLADKLPYVDHAVDVVGTLVRPMAGALVGTSLVVGAEPLLAAVAGIAAGGAVAGLTHAGKATLRVGSTASSGGLANPLVSLVEDVLVLGAGGLAALVASGTVTL